MNYGQVCKQELAAIDQLLTAHRADVRQLQAAPVGWGESSRVKARVEYWGLQIALLERCVNELRQPFTTPSSFAEANRQASCNSPTMIRMMVTDIKYWTDKSGYLVSGLPDYSEQCLNLDQCVASKRKYAGEKARAALVTEFMNEVQFWDAARLQREIDEREFERGRVRSERRILKVFTTDQLIVDDDPADLAGPFLRDLLLELKTLFRQKRAEEIAGFSNIDPLVADIAQRAVQQIAGQVSTASLRDQLVRKCAEMKTIMPPDYHRSLDEFFRRELDKISKGGTP